MSPAMPFDEATSRRVEATYRTPDVVEQLLDVRAPASADSAAGEIDAGRDGADLKISLWDPSTQLRYRAKRSVPPRPDGAPNRAPSSRRPHLRRSGDEPEDNVPSPVSAGWGD